MQKKIEESHIFDKYKIEESYILADNKIEESYIYLKSEEIFYVF